ncbi:Srb8p [Sporobolomyces koalae]|uniref:Srb8p n=1 Tax=Sporobolomyces koalae TaxID=500713 RepID=UPI00317AB1EE
MSRAATARRPSTSSTRSGSSNQQTVDSTSHEFRPSPIDAILAEQGLQRYRLEPPSWRAPWTGPDARERDVEHEQLKAATWPVFYPTVDGMDEDQLTEAAADTFSAHGHIVENLKAKSMLENLSRIVTAVQIKREMNLPTYGPSTFRLPSRITLTDNKREAWFSDLANPAVPLAKLSRSVPHGYKGEKGLDMLAARKVQVERAVWFVRAFGGVEIQSLAKSRPLTTAIAQYTSEFTTVVCEFVRKQLLELALPESEPSASTTASGHNRTRTHSAGLASSTSASAPKPPSDFQNPEARTAWKDKFDYTLALLSALLAASLLSSSQFIRFLVSLIEPSVTSLAQLSVALLLVEEHWDRMLESEPSTARFARSCLIRLEEVEHSNQIPTSPLYRTLATTLTSLIRSAFLSQPDAFVSLFPAPIFPSTCLASSSVSLLPAQIPEKLESVLLQPTSSEGTAENIDQDPAALAMIRADLADLAHRRLDCTTISPLDLSPQPESNPTETRQEHGSRERAHLELISCLDNFAFPQTVASLHAQIFLTSGSTPSLPASCATPDLSRTSPNVQLERNGSVEPPRPRARSRRTAVSLEDALPILFTWSTTPCRAPGLHRRSVVANIVALELERAKEAEERERGRQGARTRSKAPTTNRVQAVVEGFINWVDENYGPRSEKPSDSQAKTLRHLGTRADVRSLGEELMRVEALSYGKYMQRMIARGETDRPALGGVEESLHLWILQTAAIGNVKLGHKGAERGRPTDHSDIDLTQEELSRVRDDLSKLVHCSKDHHESEADVAPASVPPMVDIRSLFDCVSQLVIKGYRLQVSRTIVLPVVSTLDPSQQAAFNPETFAIMVNILDTCQDPSGLLQLVVLLLRFSSSSVLIVEICDVVSSRFDLWAAIGELSNLAGALAARFDSSLGSARRKLLACLRPLVVGGHLKGAVGEAILANGQVLGASTVPPASVRPTPSSPLAEIQSLASDSSTAAVTNVAATLHLRYGNMAMDSWVPPVIDAAIQLLGQLSSIDPIVTLLKELDERFPEGLESIFVRWMGSKPPQNLVSILGGPQGLQLVNLLSELVVEGVLSLPVLVSDGFLPLWRSILALVLPELAKAANGAGSSALSLDPTLSRALSLLTDALARAVNDPSSELEAEDSPKTPILPSDLLRQQRKSLRLGCLFRLSSLAAVSSLLALLVLQQEVFAVATLSDKAQAASSLFLSITGSQPFQSLVLRDPQSVRSGMLDNALVRALPSFETFKPKILAGLLVALKDGGEATPANLLSTEDWDLFLSGLTIWRLAVSKVEVEACLERLELDSSLSSQEKNEALHTLSNHFLERVCAGGGQTYLGEQVVRCYHGVASDELVSVAFTRLATCVTTLASTTSSDSAQESAATAIRCTLRLLETLLQSGMASSRALALRQLLEAVKLCFKGLENIELTETSSGSILLLVNVLGICIRCSDSPADQSTVELFVDCLSACATLSTSITGMHHDGTPLATLLLDTCSHLLLALPDLAASPRALSIHSFVHSLTASGEETRPSILDPYLSDTTFARLTQLFGPYTPSCSVPNPWDLLDHSEPSTAAPGFSATALGKSIAQKAVASAAGYRSPLTNGGPIDLAAFRSRILETVPPVTALDALSTTSSSSTSSARPSSLASSVDARGRQTNFDFETPCTGLSIHARDHRRTTSIARSLAAKFDQAASGLGPPAGPGSLIAGRKRNNTGDSLPAKVAPPSVNDSTKREGVNGPQTQSNQSIASSTRGTKRKATDSNAEVIVLDDDDQEPTKAATVKKGKTAAKSVATTKGKKKK